ncbi:TM0106 family RecB-like putative nuclease [Knoellia aerolata]|uniref:Nuclease n=1 Tax=Knoellia aerolata DSM 18566 TaxID=1385519 RepID=A0A0A0JXX9_9MICO|nr:bifunctional RecB family nuclease/DEAD/DEAH box helicase [Knoellia aerolata]KGN42003.1 nuclease [Knoellia aerolata DSM 18566]
MFFFPGEDRPVISPHDLRTASECEFALIRDLDRHLGRAVRADDESSPMMDRIIELGNAHENAERIRLGRLHPGRVRDLTRGPHSREGYEAAMQQTLEALGSDAVVLCQATFFDGDVLGYADFLERTDAGWLVSDTKLARSANVPALLQIAAYAAQLQDRGVPTAPWARLVLGNEDRRDFPLADIVPVYRSRLARLQRIIGEHLDDDGPGAWGDDRWIACGRCDVCEAEVAAHRDLTLVAGVRPSTRKHLLGAGITTIDDLAASTGSVDGIQESRLERLRAQARLQLTQLDDVDAPVAYEVFDEAPIRRLPVPTAGDLFFDFEGDPLWAERGSKDWGLEYLFGVVEVDSGADAFHAFWAHDREQEKQALVEFVAYVQERRRRWPGLHIYHYAPYETAALKQLASRHGVCEDDIDQFLRDEVFVDLYATVRGAIRVSQRSYSIKKLEPLYMEARTADLQKGDDSIVEYHRFMMARLEERFAAAQDILDGIAEYNKDDCISTRLLRDWLVSRVPDGGVGEVVEALAPRPLSDERAAALRLEADLRALVEGVKLDQRTPEDHAVALVAASVLFHAREDKPFWWEHYERIKHPVQNWMRSAGVAVVEGEPELLAPWHKPTPRSGMKRIYAVRVDPAGGTLLDVGGKVAALYSAPPSFPAPADHLPGNAHARSPGTVEIIEAEEEITDRGRVFQRLTILENAPAKAEIDDFPVAFVPGGTVGTKNIDEALHELAREVLQTHPTLPRRAGIDVLRRTPPRLRTGASLPAPGSGDARFIEAITAALTDMDDSYVAVQGPPGTGKTYVGARVIARLVRLGWKVGICSQGHAAVENILDAVVRAGVPGTQVAKAPKYANAPAWTALDRADDLAPFIAERAEAGLGVVVGGTAWDLTNTGRIQRGSLDLVVIDEAGQFSLGKTLAVSMAGRRLLLLGDPAQLPQVSQGTHAEPIDHSALGWLAGDDDLLPPELGYFLEATWRMHPRLTEAVSHLSYAGRLTSEEHVTAVRTLQGVEPGVHEVLVEHRDNKNFSPEEADVVVELVTDLLGRTWTAGDEPGAEAGRPLTQQDFCVITPYNSQVGMLKVRLRAAGFDEVAVGTVDKFQGQEAPVAILSMAASAPGDVSRGMGFLLNRNRVNVAISRGKHAAYVVRSAVLTDFSPRSPDELIALGAFLGLCEHATSTTSRGPSAHVG